ncbi:hypothetical protein BegalDRAFT_0487 [Beggiatoa alba B18LD]|uniref:Formate dehydrogenase region TAT target n=1 Tax=Beggiatoa alba B18LD TaxID=395493 RepID=I3CCR2_9GAMM|nr:twin-arginine translocation signal domain-containing protein [Beggiatoa alba]EIJ41405.1 hypothetical protein BegalDRAFT_0487 [Beggiatoa alba B18LD]
MTIQKERREFLKNLAVLGSATAVVSSTVVNAETAIPSESPARDATQATHAQGYHLTPHIEAYYKTLQF